MTTTTVGETRDGTGSGDHDVAYTWGHARSYLTLRQQAMLVIMRGYVLDCRAGAVGGAADGDIDWVNQTPTGVYLPAGTESR